MSKGQYVSCLWTCLTCVKSGLVRPWKTFQETRAAAAESHQRRTRANCVEGCRYQCTVQSRKRSPDAT